MGQRVDRPCNCRVKSSFCKHSPCKYIDDLPRCAAAVGEEGGAGLYSVLGLREPAMKGKRRKKSSIAAHYRDKLMGDSYDLMPLNSSLFGDLIKKVAWLVVPTTDLEEEGKQFSMGTPDNAWKKVVAAWDLVPKKRIVEDIERFIPALEAIVKVDGTYVSDKDLCNSHRKVMRRMVRGGAIQERDGKEVEVIMEEGLAFFASWEGMANKINAKHLKNSLFQSYLFLSFRLNCIYIY